MRISDQVAMKLQALIEERHMKKGDRLPAERQLATSLGVSRPSLREAIQQLHSQGCSVAAVAMGPIFSSYLNSGHSN